MNIEQELKSVIHLAAIAFNKNEYDAKRDNKKFESEKDLEQHKNEINYKRRVISKLVDSMGQIKSYLSEDGIAWALPSEYELLIANYLHLNRSVFEVKIGISTFDVESFRSVEKLMSLSDEIVKSIQFFAKERTLLSDVEKSLIPNVIELLMMFNLEVVAFPMKLEGDQNLIRIDREFDTIKASLDSKLGEVSRQYSEGRASLLASVEEYKKNINLIIEDAEGRLEGFATNLDNFNLDVENKKIEIEDAMKSANEYLVLAEGMLKVSSQVGMAAAFQRRHDALKWPVILWFITFFGCLSGLTMLGVTIVQDVFTTAPVVELGTVLTEKVSLVEFLSRLAISFPLIWGAWFSAKQYSHISQLREDYAYKVAIAMTYHGYKDEAGNVDEKMGGKLLDSIISQFSDNPVRLYRNNNDASVFEAMIKNDKVSDIMNAAQKMKQ